MKLPTFGFGRRSGRLHNQTQAGLGDDAPNAGLEPLEPRLLLSGVSVGGLPQVNDPVDVNTETYYYDMPLHVHARSVQAVSGTVFIDIDGDGLRDPYEHALTGATIFADVDGDGLLGTGEASALTNGSGVFDLSELPIGDYDVRLQIPDGYKPSQDGSDAAGVSIAQDLGVGGLSLSLARTGFNLGLAFSDVSMPKNLKTGTRVKLPVIVTNQGDQALPERDVRLRVFVSSDQTHSSDDIRLATRPMKHGLAPGESVKVELEVKLPDALSDFRSYLIVDAVGKGLRTDTDPSDNHAVGDRTKTFVASDRDTFLQPDELDVVLQQWDVVLPYGGIDPGYGYGGDGFVGIDDLNIVLGNWNAGTPPPATPLWIPAVSDVEIEGGHLVPDTPTLLTARGRVEYDAHRYDRVMFFYDADADGKVDDYLGVDTDGTDGFSILAKWNPVKPMSTDGRFLAIAVETNGDPDANYVSASPRLRAEVSAAKDLVFREVDGSVVTVSLTGSGSAQVILKGDGIASYDLGDTIEVTGDVTLEDIHLVDTNGGSKLTIETTGGRGGGKRVSMTGRLTGSTHLGLFSATKVELWGGIHMTGRGVIRTLKAAIVNGINMPGKHFAKGVTISAAKVTNNITLGSPLRLLNAGSMSNVRLTTPRAERILVKRDYKVGRITLTDADADLSLGLLQVGRRMQRVQVRAAASIDTVRVKSMIRSGVQVGSRSWLSSPTLNASQAVQRGLIIKHLIVDGGVFANSFASAWRLGSVSLDAAKRSTSSSLYGLMYHRLGRYDGPDSVDRTVI